MSDRYWGVSVIADIYADCLDRWLPSVARNGVRAVGLGVWRRGHIRFDSLPHRDMGTRRPVRLGSSIPAKDDDRARDVMASRGLR